MHTVHTGIIILILKVITSFFLDPKKDIFVLFGLVTTLVSNFVWTTLTCTVHDIFCKIRVCSYKEILYKEDDQLFANLQP